MPAFRRWISLSRHKPDERKREEGRTKETKGKISVRRGLARRKTEREGCKSRRNERYYPRPGPADAPRAHFEQPGESAGRARSVSQNRPLIEVYTEGVPRHSEFANSGDSRDEEEFAYEKVRTIGQRTRATHDPGERQVRQFCSPR